MIAFILTSLAWRARTTSIRPAPARPEEGVVSLALGLGKTIVDGGISWTFSPAYPKKPPPFGSVYEMLRGTQTDFWAVNMGKPPAYDPVSETEYLVKAGLKDAEADGVLRFLASTFDPSRDRVVPGTWARSGPRILDFAPLLVLGAVSLNRVIKTLLKAADETMGANVEIEFAVTIRNRSGGSAAGAAGISSGPPHGRVEQSVEVTVDDLADPHAIVASEMVMGNGVIDDIHDIVFVRPENFSVMQTPAIAEQLGIINRQLSEQHRPFLLIGFGRWGSSHPSLGIPVVWSQISGARVIVEATLPEMNVELSQGSHFFHNLSSFRASYFMVRHDGRFAIDWPWLNRQPMVQETEFVRHVRSPAALTARVDGRNGRGVILSGESAQVSGKEK